MKTPRTLATNLLGLVLGIVVTGACGGDDGGGDGLSNSTRLNALATADIDALCPTLASLSGGKRTFDCGGGSTVTVGVEDDASCRSDQAALMGKASCQATVGDAKDCAGALADVTASDACGGNLPPACAPVFQCAAGAGFTD